MNDLQRILDALGSPVRREILWMIWDTERPAGEIAAAFEVRPPTISEHLAVLRDAGLVSMQADGPTGAIRPGRTCCATCRRWRSMRAPSGCPPTTCPSGVT